MNIIIAVISLIIWSLNRGMQILFPRYFLCFRSRSSRNMMKQLGSLLVQKEKEKRIDVMNNSQPLANLR